MINWDSINYGVSNAEEDFDRLTIDIDGIKPINLTPEFEELRNKFLKIRDDIYAEKKYDLSNKKLDYEFDLLFGLQAYQILNKSIGFTNRVASNDDVWRFLMVRVIPDIAHARWGLSAKYYYKESRSIWLKRLWWYIELSWMGNAAKTFEILKNNSTDTIKQLVERPGVGYHVDLYREIMYQYSKHEDQSRDLFRRVLPLNVARLLTSSPELVDGGIKAYVNQLFEIASS